MFWGYMKLKLMLDDEVLIAEVENACIQIEPDNEDARMSDWTYLFHHGEAKLGWNSHGYLSEIRLITNSAIDYKDIENQEPNI